MFVHFAVSGNPYLHWLESASKDLTVEGGAQQVGVGSGLPSTPTALRYRGRELGLDVDGHCMIISVCENYRRPCSGRRGQRKPCLVAVDIG
jgi:hypothetical protein